MAELHLMVKRTGIDKTWTRAPYDISSEAQAGRIAEWLKQSLPPFEWHVARGDPPQEVDRGSHG